MWKKFGDKRWELILKVGEITLHCFPIYLNKLAKIWIIFTKDLDFF